jgi:hypothetical protein
MKFILIVFTVCLFLSFAAYGEDAPKKAKYTRGVLVGRPDINSYRNDILADISSFRECSKLGEGKAVIRFTVGKNGYAYAPKVEGDVPLVVKNCAIAALVSIHFQPYTEGDDVEVSQPIDFKAVNLTID